jgi:hypothetical protein
LLPFSFLASTSARVCTGYHHSRFYFLIPAKTTDPAIRPGNFSGAVSGVAKRYQRGSKEEAKRTQRGGKEDPKRKQRGPKEEAKRTQIGSKEDPKRKQRGEQEMKPLIYNGKQVFFEKNLPVIPDFVEECPRFSRITSHFLHYRGRHALLLFYQRLTKEFSLKANGKSGPGNLLR